MDALLATAPLPPKEPACCSGTEPPAEPMPIMLEALLL
jgi:hypothetical protein